MRRRNIPHLRHQRDPRSSSLHRGTLATRQRDDVVEPGHHCVLRPTGSRNVQPPCLSVTRLTTSSPTAVQAPQPTPMHRFPASARGYQAATPSPSAGSCRARASATSARARSCGPRPARKCSMPTRTNSPRAAEPDLAVVAHGLSRDPQLATLLPVQAGGEPVRFSQHDGAQVLHLEAPGDRGGADQAQHVAEQVVADRGHRAAVGQRRRALVRAAEGEVGAHLVALAPGVQVVAGRRVRAAHHAGGGVRRQRPVGSGRAAGVEGGGRGSAVGGRRVQGGRAGSGAVGWRCVEGGHPQSVAALRRGARV